MLSSASLRPTYCNLWLVCLPLVISACGFIEYVAKPINQQTVIQKIENKTPDSEQFKQYLLNNDDAPSVFPIRNWRLNDLIYCALFFHPSLDVAREQWRAAEASQAIVGAKPLPNMNGNFGKSNNVNGDINPYTYGLSIDIPVVTANKRNIRIENAAHLSETAKLDLAQVAWNLRAQITNTYYELQSNKVLLSVLLQELTYREEIVNLYQKRLDLGLASKIELSHAKLILQTIKAELNTQQQNKLVLTAKLASNLGLPLLQVQEMALADAPNAELLIANSHQNLAKNAQSIALLNRIDLRIALERYAIAEGKLKLEIARQYPDLTISPSYLHEFGSQIWSLGFSGLLTLLNKNKYAIAEADQLREVEVAQFEALQSTIISETQSALAKLTQTVNMFANSKKQYALQRDNTKHMQSVFDAGEIDRLELTMTKLEELISEKNLMLTNFQLYTSINNLENTLQRPLNEHSAQPSAFNTKFSEQLP